ncbi:MAG: zf-HC2 domain-containing protein [Spirochaetales bacterium]|nr:zf-HC2 domain-containing protein [Spirochaetales bacterium]
MCPEEELLSAYIDNELPLHWKKRVEEHITQCEACARRLDDFLTLRRRLQEAEVRIDEPLSREVCHTAEVRWEVLQPRFIKSFRRGVSLPVFAAACALAFLLGMFLFFDRGGEKQPSYLAEDLVIPVEERNIRTLEEALKVFESHNANIDIYIQLPERSDFYTLGEPVLIREAELKQRL